MHRALLAVALIATTAGAWAQTPARVTPPPPPAASPALDRQDIRAQLSPRRFTTLAAELGAKVNRVSVREGERFKSGQVLIVLDCSLQTAQLNKAKATLAAADQTYAANRRLAELNSVGKLELDTSHSEVAKARADVALMNATLSKCQIVAPFSGRVSEQKIREQQFAQPGQGILEILDDSALELEFIVPSRWMAWLKDGYRFQVKIDETGITYPAKVTRLGAKVDPVSQSVKAVAVIDGQFSELIAGMSGRVMLAPPASAPAPQK
ncbi:efflux RND transporter periplasmic adaptor subunit [Zoogloea sp.]|uniref:efflux RND transporter periplasmic adaptor subunit n=1 Tax=Zoogloea sp. TaxID=49181 RepID=UPI002637A7AB|nr:efflux RND transporter periplasmic adaptor subunit [Zoogloea sp.]